MVTAQAAFDRKLQPKELAYLATKITTKKRVAATMLPLSKLHGSIPIARTKAETAPVPDPRAPGKKHCGAATVGLNITTPGVSGALHPLET